MRSERATARNFCIIFFTLRVPVERGRYIHRTGFRMARILTEIALWKSIAMSRLVKKLLQ
jgi:hypothetical protein